MKLSKLKGQHTMVFALALMRISKAILNNENNVLNVYTIRWSLWWPGKGAYLGVPTLVNQHGAVKIYEMPLCRRTSALFDKSVKH